jgi:segregation and condensation protein B
VTREKTSKGKSAPPRSGKPAAGRRAKLETEPSVESDRPTLEDIEPAGAFTPPPGAHDGAVDSSGASEGNDVAADAAATGLQASEPTASAAEAMDIDDVMGASGTPGNDADASAGDRLDDAAEHDAAEHDAAEHDASEQPTGKPPAVAEGAVTEGADADVEQARELTGAHLRGLLEALVFASDKPMKTGELARLASAPSRQVKEVMGELRADYSTRGIVLDEVAGGWLFRTNAQYAPFVRDLAGGRPVKLTRAQIETLAIAAYRQPITRPEIDEIRGVDSGATLKLLLERDLVRILGKKDEPGRPLLYGTTNHFLEFFNMKSLKDLPTLREFTELSDESRRVAEAELGEVLPEATRAALEPAMAPPVPPEEDLVDAPMPRAPFDEAPFDDGAGGGRIADAPLPNLPLDDTPLDEGPLDEGPLDEPLEEDEDSARDTIAPPTDVDP